MGRNVLKASSLRLKDTRSKNTSGTSAQADSGACLGLLPQECEHHGFGLAGRGRANGAVEGSMDYAGAPTFEHGGIDIGLAADRGGVMQLCRHLLDDVDDFTLAGGLARGFGQRRTGE